LRLRGFYAFSRLRVLFLRRRGCGPKQAETKRESEREGDENQRQSFSFRIHKFPRCEKILPPPPSGKERIEVNTKNLRETFIVDFFEEGCAFLTQQEMDVNAENGARS
jgi:hypothetical protein